MNRDNSNSNSNSRNIPGGMAGQVDADFNEQIVTSVIKEYNYAQGLMQQYAMR